MKNEEQYKKAVWQQAQREVGIPVPPLIRSAFDTSAATDNIEKYKRNVYAFTQAYKLEMASKLLPRPQKIQKGPRGPYQRSLNKRAHLVRFVIDKQLTYRNSNQPSYKDRPRIKWKKIRDAWNEAHPYDLMTPAILKATYYRAAKDSDVQQQCIASWWNDLFEELQNELSSGAISLTLPQPGQMDEPLPQDFQNAMEYLSQYRSIIKSKPLIQAFGKMLGNIAVGSTQTFTGLDFDDYDKDMTIKYLQELKSVMEEANNERTHSKKIRK